jgi:hypothetical protein
LKLGKGVTKTSEICWSGSNNHWSQQTILVVMFIQNNEVSIAPIFLRLWTGLGIFPLSPPLTKSAMTRQRSIKSSMQRHEASASPTASHTLQFCPILFHAHQASPSHPSQKLYTPCYWLTTNRTRNELRAPPSFTPYRITVLGVTDGWNEHVTAVFDTVGSALFAVSRRLTQSNCVVLVTTVVELGTG